DSAKLNWSASGTYYDIEWGVQGFTPGEGTMVTNLEATTHTLTSLDYYTQYEFYVLSKCPNIELESEWVGPFTFMTLPLPCATPTDLSIDNITVDSASISWMSDGELFDIQWGTSGFQLGYGTVVSGIQTTTYDLTSLNGYTQYQVYVRKDCSVNQSDWVGPFAFTTLMPECVVPTELAVSNITADSATLNWTSDGSLFHIQYGEQGFSLGSGTI